MNATLLAAIARYDRLCRIANAEVETASIAIAALNEAAMDVRLASREMTSEGHSYNELSQVSFCICDGELVDV